MRVGWWTIAIMTAWLGPVADARADGVCVRIDRARDSLTAAEQRGLRAAIEAALEREGVAVDRAATTDGAPGAASIGPSLDRSCPAGISGYAVRLGEAVTVTLTLGDGKVSGRAASLDEVDLLVSQLVRSLVTGRSLATGGGVTDRANVLRDQTAPRRVDASASRRWDPMVAIGGGMLQLPALGDRTRQRQYDVVSIESRWWGFLTGERSAVEIAGRLLLHDYAAIGAADDAYDRARDGQGGEAGGRLAALVFSPLAVANYEAGLGVVVLAGARAPRPYLRVGATMSILCRLSDPEHRLDVGLGGYVGVGVELSSRLGLSIAAHGSNPVVHDFLDSGYRYFLTTTALLEIRGEGRQRRLPRALAPEPPPVIRRIHE